MFNGKNTAHRKRAQIGIEESQSVNISLRSSPFDA